MNPDWLIIISRLEFPEDLKNLITEDLRDMVSYGFSDDAIESFLEDIALIHAAQKKEREFSDL